MTLQTRSALGTLLDSRVLSYSATETETVVDFARRSVGDHIADIRIADIEPADTFDVEAVLNVTD